MAPGMAEGGFSLDVFLPAAEILWMSAALGLFLFRLGKVVWLSRWLRRTARPSPEGEAALRRIAGEKCRTPVLCSDKIATPLTMGLFRPVILLPDREIDEKDMEYALLHEWQHCRCRDLWVKGFLFGAACIQWWNPLGWILVREGERLCEEACDQRVTGTMSREERRLYGLAILNLLGKNFPGTAALSGGGKNLERRLKQMMNGKATKKSILAAAILAALALGCGGTVLAASLVLRNRLPKRRWFRRKNRQTPAPRNPNWLKRSPVRRRLWKRPPNQKKFRTTAVSGTPNWLKRRPPIRRTACKRPPNKRKPRTAAIPSTPNWLKRRLLTSTGQLPGK